MAEFWFQSVIAGGLLGHALWVCLAPRRRLSRLGVILPACSLLAWATFLVFGESADGMQPSCTSLPDGSSLCVTDGPVMVAGRVVGTFGSITFADRILTLAAQPAILYAWQVALWVSGAEAEASVRHSYWVAGGASTIAAAFWLAVGNAIAARRARRASLAAARRRESAAV